MRILAVSPLRHVVAATLARASATTVTSFARRAMIGSINGNPMPRTRCGITSGLYITSVLPKADSDGKKEFTPKEKERKAYSMEDYAHLVQKIRAAPGWRLAHKSYGKNTSFFRLPSVGTATFADPLPLSADLLVHQGHPLPTSNDSFIFSGVRLAGHGDATLLEASPMTVALTAYKGASHPYFSNGGGIRIIIMVIIVAAVAVYRLIYRKSPDCDAIVEWDENPSAAPVLTTAEGGNDDDDRNRSESSIARTPSSSLSNDQGQIFPEPAVEIFKRDVEEQPVDDQQQQQEQLVEETLGLTVTNGPDIENLHVMPLEKQVDATVEKTECTVQDASVCPTTLPFVRRMQALLRPKKNRTLSVEHHQDKQGPQQGRTKRLFANNPFTKKKASTPAPLSSSSFFSSSSTRSPAFLPPSPTIISAATFLSPVSRPRRSSTFDLPIFSKPVKANHHRPTSQSWPQDHQCLQTRCNGRGTIPEVDFDFMHDTPTFLNKGQLHHKLSSEQKKEAVTVQAKATKRVTFDTCLAYEIHEGSINDETKIPYCPPPRNSRRLPPRKKSPKKRK